MNEITITIQHLAYTAGFATLGLGSIAIAKEFRGRHDAERKLAELRERLNEYSTIVNAEAKAESIVLEAHSTAEEIEGELAGAKDKLKDYSGAITIANEQLAAARKLIDDGRAELGLHSAIREMQEYGLFEPRFKFDHSDDFKYEIKRCVDQQRSMVKAKTACVCQTNWEVNGNRRDGRTMTNRNIKLTLRAFNGECTGTIASVTFRTFDSCARKIEKSYEAINKLGATNDIEITWSYLQLKLDELRLHYEWARKKQDEKELERERRELLREETRVQKETQSAIQQAERDERQLSQDLDSARKQFESQTGEQANRLETLISDLELRLAEALDRKAKAVARAQLTRSGFVYVLSNIGAFGEGIFKIGLTRRLDPQERVQELASASVPFPFDVHAMIYSEDAPALERSLHRKFDDFRVNKVNGRKEYFRVKLDDIADAVSELHGSVTFMHDTLAAEYRETVAKGRGESQSTVQESMPRTADTGESKAHSITATSKSSEHQTTFPTGVVPLVVAQSSPTEIA